MLHKMSSRETGAMRAIITSRSSRSTEFLGVTHAAVGEDGRFAGGKAGLCSKVLGGVGLHAAGLARIVQAGGPQHHQVGGLKLHPALGKGMLNRLVLSDRPPEDDALLGIARGTRQRRPA